MFVCVECGSNNPCRCKVLGPTLGLIGALLTAIVAYPLGALCCCVSRSTSDRMFAAPADVFTVTSATLPI
ncbi:hypothetical protein CHLRE_03g207152v5 [Chlamydomonas reinhardtii]|uniref:Uncharacterized protein n=1 Tax=Chlamydomonas reinhardtii TaxID=3055 RepID=A0A2K3DZ14_CHLRE|nr:uncharacterized protein CHLRE_03g207152v5 [Chlamydomonas reinhardtii]PNW85747.1 hypothetical protein CHLRE_03g207152v5 [Chlamydomonas reinhardtii]